MVEEIPGRGAASCGVHRFADVMAWERFERDKCIGTHPCPWCQINKLTERAEEAEAEVMRLRAELDGGPARE